MATNDLSKIAKILLVAGGLSGATAPDAAAQSQMQGNLLGGVLRPSGSKPPPARHSRFNKQADCAAQGKEKGMKGPELRAFQQDCVNGTLSSPVEDSPPSTATQTPPEPDAQPTAK
jgi:hypothetical protein